MIRFMRVSVVMFAFLSAPAVAGPKRQLDAHDHGHGTLNIAIEGTQITMELEVPGADIVGFEHMAKRAGDKAKIEAAKKTLSNPLSLFVVPDAAGCELASSDVSLIGEDHDSDAGDDHASKEKEMRADETSHSEFHGEWKLTCSNIDAMTTMRFPYFNIFPGAQELDVRMISKNGQRSFEVERENASIDLRGII